MTERMTAATEKMGEKMEEKRDTPSEEAAEDVPVEEAVEEAVEEGNSWETKILLKLLKKEQLFSPKRFPA